MSDSWRIGGRYVVGGRLGVGGMAEVFRAHDEVLGRDVAVKVFRTPTSATDTASRVERREAELHALARLNHPNLITLYDGELNEQPAYLVMELVEGASLADRIADGALAEHACRELGRQIAGALFYVHAQGMVHRDVKPANILLGDDGRARLSDFGIVRLLDRESLTNADSTLGTASYLAPEQMRGSQVGPAADVYALGLTLIEALTGTRSFDGPPLEAAMARLARDPVIPAHVAGPWPRLLAAMTARESSARPNAEQVAIALRTADGAPAGLPADAAGATVPLAALAAASTASDTTAATASTTAMPPVHRPAPPVAPVAPVEPVGLQPPPRRSVPGGLIAAAAVVIVLLIAGVAALLISGATSDDSPAGGATSPAPSTSRSSAAPSTSAAPSRSSSASSSAPSSDTAPATESAPPSSSGSSSSTGPSSSPPSTSTSASSSSVSSSSSSSSSASSTAVGAGTAAAVSPPSVGGP